LARAVLICINGDRPQLLEDRATIGRQKSCDIVLPIEAISKHHATIYRENGAWYIVDENSTNGTFVNGVEISKPTAISPGDIVRLNNSADITFKSSAAEDDTAPGWGNLTDVVRELGNRLHLLEQGMGQLAEGVKSLAERQEDDEKYKICAKEYDERANAEIEALKLAGDQNIATTIQLKIALVSGIWIVICGLCLNTVLSFSNTPEKRSDLIAAISNEVRSEWGAQALTLGMVSFLGLAAKSIKRNLAELDEQRSDSTTS
jgi:pSer/pThr/pTyr-binding forkhead associated (FHA) protein